MGKSLTDADLLPTERVLASKLANLWVKPSEHGLTELALGAHLGTAEALGGRAYLTTYRVLFRPHGFNRLVAAHSLLLPNVVRVRRGWFGVGVDSRAQVFDLVMWFNRGFVDALEDARRGLGRAGAGRLRALVRDHPDRLGSLLPRSTLAAVEAVVSGALEAADVVGDLPARDRAAFAEVVALFAADE